MIRINLELFECSGQFLFVRHTQIMHSRLVEVTSYGHQLTGPLPDNAAVKCSAIRQRAMIAYNDDLIFLMRNRKPSSDVPTVYVE